MLYLCSEFANSVTKLIKLESKLRKMKVGILTFHNTTNYGATLQAYALSTIIGSQGHDVEIIDYCPYKVEKYYKKDLYFIDKNRRLNRRIFDNLLKYYKTRKFLVSKTNISKKKYATSAELKKINSSYEVVVCGSDQIWCIDSFRGFDSAYFLDFIDNKTDIIKISYAASFGHTMRLRNYRELICQLISNFSAISVRDANSRRLLKEECNEQAVKVLDPTFLIEYDEYFLDKKFKKEYLLIYIISGITLEQKTFIKFIANYKNLEIISVGKYVDIATKNIIGIGPKEWINYFSHASYIMTNTYHGTIFSILFRKPFIVLDTLNKANKINDLLKDFNLENRLNSKSNFIENFNKNILDIEYSLIEEDINQAISNSKNFLKTTINSK
ncbi:hypothetical protein MC7420_3742 [Coleofasciculus chthonoplastes PCC 7420]|uniref:Polysaccharide pyruvyl transferase domain-containing protein n=2 Tax=Coleofasciculus chthonoplastes TaxID=64178 RepID=B4VX55_9CYAN|nr:hypothetical protein MC7420_3742 [Coleofasciculus chthonoplastes PCC 7420]